MLELIVSRSQTLSVGRESSARESPARDYRTERVWLRETIVSGPQTTIRLYYACWGVSPL